MTFSAHCEGEPAIAGNSSEGAASTSEVVPPDAPSTPVKRSQVGVHTKEETSPILVTPLPWKPGEGTPPAGKATLSERSLLGEATLKATLSLKTMSEEHADIK